MTRDAPQPPPRPSTRLVLAHRRLGYRCIFTMPSTIATEKVDLMRTLGAEVVLCDPVPFASPAHYYHTAGAIAAARSSEGAVWLNQFENTANSDAHIATTAPEIWAQSGGKVGLRVTGRRGPGVRLPASIRGEWLRRWTPSSLPRARAAALAG